MILGRARNIKNCFAPINRLPPEILAQIAMFFPRERHLIDATAVCQHWRSALLSFPRLWRDVGGSLSEIQAYLERSGSTSLDVTLLDPSLVNLIVPHTSRLVGLALRINHSLSFNQIIEHLHHPIPTLRSFRISTVPPLLHTLELPPCSDGSFFLYSRKLEIKGISVFHAPRACPYVTDLTLHTNGYQSIQMDPFLRTLEELPLLEKVYIVFCSDMYTDVPPRLATLPHVRTMSLSRFGKSSIPVRLPQILEYLQLPKLTSLHVQVFPRSVTFRPIFPVATFGRHLPNLTELSELHVDMGSGEVTFQNSSLATLKYHTELLSTYDSVERKIWGGLPLHSVRRLTVNMVSQSNCQQLACTWLVELLRDLRSLEHLELGGRCESAIRSLCQEMTKEPISVPIRTLTVRCEEQEKPQALRLKQLADAAGLITVLIFVPDPEVREEGEMEADANGPG